MTAVLPAEPIVTLSSASGMRRTAPLDEPLAPEPERTLTIDERTMLVARSASLVNQAWILRSDTDELHAEIVDGHTELEAKEIERRAQDLAKAGLPALLGSVAEAGLAWVDVAALVGVSVPAVRKWRMGGAASGEKLLELARLVALISWLGNDKATTDVASWLEVPLSPDAPITRMDLLKSGHRDLVVRSMVGEGLSPEAMLDEFQPGWRSAHESDFEVFTAADGQHSIRAK